MSTSKREEFEFRKCWYTPLSRLAESGQVRLHRHAIVKPAVDDDAASEALRRATPLAEAVGLEELDGRVKVGLQYGSAAASLCSISSKPGRTRLTWGRSSLVNLRLLRSSRERARRGMGLGQPKQVLLPRRSPPRARRRAVRAVQAASLSSGAHTTPTPTPTTPTPTPTM